jgi:hypothetical protein
MNNMRNLYLIFSCSLLFSFASAQSNKKSMASFMEYSTECIGTDMSGTQIVKAYAKGLDKKEVLEQAKKNAIYDVIFKGITLGKQNCNLKPLILDPNLKDQNESYFNQFFAENGMYKKFINQKNSKVEEIFKPKDKKLDKVFAITAIIDVPSLKKELTNKGFIQKEF